MILSFLLFFAGPSLAQQGTHTLPSGEVDLIALTKQISEITGFSFLYGSEFSGKANLIINHKVTSKEAFEIYISVLADKGYTTIENGRLIKIIKKGDGVDPNLLFLKGEPVGPSDKRVTVFIDINYVESGQMAADLQPLISKEGKLLASPVGNRLIIVDHAANVEKIRKAVAAMDQQGAKIKIEVIKLERASAAAVADMLTRLFENVGKARGTGFGRKFTAIADARTNSVVIQAPENEIVVASKLLKRIDDPSHPNRVTVEYLKHAGSEEISKLFKSLE